MKKRKIIAPLILFLSFYIGQAQLVMIDGETGEYRYEDVARAEGISSSMIKERAKRWLNEYYGSEQVIKEDTAGIEQINQFSFSWKLIRKEIPVELFFKVGIKTKDNRYKYDFHDFQVGKIVQGDIQAVPLKKYLDRFPHEYVILIEEPIDQEITKAIGSLNYYINNDKLEVKEDDW